LKSLIFITVGKRSVAYGDKWRSDLCLKGSTYLHCFVLFCLSGRELQFSLAAGYASLTYGYENQALRAKTQLFFISNSRYLKKEKTEDIIF